MLGNDPLKQQWRPLTSTWRVLLPAAGFTMVILVFVALSLYLSFLHGYVFKVTDTTIAHVIFQYVPIVIAVLYGALWGWIDLDAKRLAPWFALSRPDRQAGHNPLLLQYPVDLGLSVPFKSAKRRHWPVFTTSMTTIAVYWAVTPLLGSVYVVKEAANSWYGSVSISAPPSSLQSPLSRTLLFSGLGVEYFSQALPPFTTKTSAFIPFSKNDSLINPSNTTVTYTTTRYTSDLRCWPPKNITIEEGPVGVNMNFDDGRGCIARNIPMDNVSASADGSFYATYLGWQFDQRTDYSLSTSGCSKIGAHRFLAIMARDDTKLLDFGNPNTSTALFCETGYFQQKVNATASSDQEIVSFEPLEELQPLETTAFNITLFEYILSTGWTPDTSTSVARSDVSATTSLTLQSLLLDRNITNGFGTMVPFGIGATQLPTETYLNGTILEQTYKEAHQLLFALAARQSIDQIGDVHASHSPATFRKLEDAVRLNTVIASILETVLALIIASIVALMILQKGRRVSLSRDPKSIADVLANIRGCQIFPFYEACLQVTNHTNGEVTELSRIAPADSDDESDGKVYHIAQAHERSGSTGSIGHGAGNASARHPLWRQPSRLNRIIIIAFACALLATVVTMCVLKIRSDRHQGLRLPALSSFAEQLLLNYLPTLLATLTEPVWIELTRTVCVYFPYTQLARRVLPAEDSLRLTYASYLPQVLVVKAILSCHFFIASLAVSGVLANVLTIAMNGLFYTSTTTNIEYFPSRPLYKPSVANGSFGSAWNVGRIDRTATLRPLVPYIQMANLSDTTVALPAWTSSEYYFIPHNISAATPSSSSFIVSTLGIGGFLDCTEHMASSSDFTYSLAYAQNMSRIDFDLSFPSQTQSTSDISCSIIYSVELRSDGSQLIGGDPSGAKAFEVATALGALYSTNDTAQIDFCAKRLVLGWFRTNATLLGGFSTDSLASDVSAPLNTANATLHSQSQTIISCLPQARIAPFNVTVSSSGHILSHAQTGPATINPTGELFQNVTNYMSTIMITGSFGTPVYHDDTFAIGWANYLMKLLTRSTAFLDSTKPPPSAEQAMEAASAVYSRLWATYASLIAEGFEQPAVGDELAVVGQRTDVARRVFISEAMFWLALAILVWDLGVCLVLWAKIPRPFMAVVPVSIAAVASLFAGSHCVDDFREGSEGRSEKDVAEEVAGGEEIGKERSYAYGNFVGTDGEQRVGIDRYPHAVPLNLRERRKWGFKEIWTRRR